MHGIDLLSRASIAVGQEDTSPNIWTGRTLSQVSPHYLKSQDRLSLFVDFMAFYFTKTFYFNVDKEASASGGLCPSSPLSGFCPCNCYFPPFMETDRHLHVYAYSYDLLARELFLPGDSMLAWHMLWPSVCPSVCLSVCLSQVRVLNMAKSIIAQTPPYA